MRHEEEQRRLKEYTREKNKLGIKCTYMGDGTYKPFLSSGCKRPFITQRNFEGTNMLKNWLVKNKIPIGQKGILCFEDKSENKHKITCVYKDNFDAIFSNDKDEDAGYLLALKMRDDGVKPWREGTLTFQWTVEESDL